MPNPAMLASLLSGLGGGSAGGAAGSGGAAGGAGGPGLEGLMQLMNSMGGLGAMGGPMGGFRAPAPVADPATTYATQIQQLQVRRRLLCRRGGSADWVYWRGVAVAAADHTGVCVLSGGWLCRTWASSTRRQTSGPCRPQGATSTQQWTGCCKTCDVWALQLQLICCCGFCLCPGAHVPLASHDRPQMLLLVYLCTGCVLRRKERSTKPSARPFFPLLLVSSRPSLALSLIDQVNPSR